jgi:uncharacterized protein
MSFDSLTFYGESLYGNSVDEETLLRALEAGGSERAIVCPLRPPEYDLGAANVAVATLASRRPETFVGICRVDPWQKGAAAAAEQAVDTLGLRGLFLHPWEETFRVNMPRVDEVVAVASARRLPVLIATGFPWLSEALQVADLARRFPESPFVLTTGGQINISGLGQADAELAVERNPNISLQTTGVYREDFILGIAARFGAERLLYASGFPQFEPRLERLRIEWAPKLDEKAKHQILIDNAAALFGGTAQSGDTQRRAEVELQGK